MRVIDVVGLFIGAVAAGFGLWLLGFADLNPCGSLSLYVDQADRSALYGSWLGFECDRWQSLPEAIVLDWVPWAIVLGLGGALATRFGANAPAWRGALIGGIVAALFFAARTLSNSMGYFEHQVSARHLLVGTAVSVLGALAGYVGGRCVRRDA